MRKLIHAAISAFLFTACCTGTATAQKNKNKLIIPAVEKKDSICFALYTTRNNTLKMLAQLYPLADSDSRDISLQIMKNGQWETVAKTKIREDSYGMDSKHDPDNSKAWNALFRVEKWDTSRDWNYRVSALDGVATYSGIIRKDPKNKNEIVVAAFTGNSNGDRSPRTDIISNIKTINPDLLFFSGDQSYDHTRHLAAWLLFGRQFGEIIKDRPTVCLPDDHDIGQGNLWGADGKKSTGAEGCADGGYMWPVQYVKEVEFAQTANLPDPFDPTPIQRGIGVHYTALNIGGIDFAIIEDRKFKSGPLGLVKTPGHKRPDLIGDPDYDRKSVDVPEAVLLGKRQLDFLDTWGRNWKNTEMKCVLSPTIFAQGCHITGPWRVVADLDSNGWPQSGRERALISIRKSFAFMLAGDQHLATVIHHGINNWNDSGYSFCVPSIVNYWGRKWHPLEKPHRKLESNQPYAGEYYDGFGNKVTMLAYANPGERKKKYGPKDQAAAGFGVVRFNKKERTITMECWPRDAVVTEPDKYSQFPGWPITITQEDNYAREAVAWLPEIRCVNMLNPVIRVINEASGETVYTIRIKGSNWQPKVFEAGTYTIEIGGQGAGKLHTLKHIRSRKDKTGKPITIESEGV
jgi:hypothetical protein